MDSTVNEFRFTKIGSAHHSIFAQNIGDISTRSPANLIGILKRKVAGDFDKPTRGRKGLSNLIQRHDLRGLQATIETDLIDGVFQDFFFRRYSAGSEPATQEPISLQFRGETN